MFKAYLDESGIHDGAPVCVIAGVFGGKGQWSRFDRDWRRLLDSFGLNLEDFHANKLLGRHGAFSGWEDKQYADFLAGIASIFPRYKIYPVSFGIVVEDFFSFNQKQRHFFTGGLMRGRRLVGTGSPTRP